ncbi:hypothetical protein ACJJIF_03095 [Microbulbifer sp. SSSA002]|uniref:hypothetical protein n=1 Tax=unclassified Microbulbifer TaxID=2619833 RepID=UPI004039C043
MCIFTGEVESVENTRIFSRQDGSRQLIIYDMYLSAKDETAMVLPIPVSNFTSGAPVEFIDLSSYSNIFDDIESLFLQWPAVYLQDCLSADSPIEVHEVGAYEASFVPTPNDFRRLDSRFSLSDTFFEQAPEYSNYGFVVFKLKAGKAKVHPMAFWFRKDDDGQLFFPTKHMHKGIVNKNDTYHHTLYAQGNFENNQGLTSVNLEEKVNNLNNIEKRSLGLVSNKENIHKKSIYGEHENKDIWISIK